MKKRLTYRDQLLELAKIYNVKEIQEAIHDNGLTGSIDDLLTLPLLKGKNLSDEEKGKAIQRDWNRYMEDN